MMGVGATARDARPFDEHGALDARLLREDFPILARRIAGRPLAYLDSAATSQKPQQVIDALTRYYVESNANVHRSAYALAEEATTAYEAARADVASFVGAGDDKQVVFTRGTTEAINLVAHSWALPRLGPGDVILLTEMEHHSNLVPWQLVAKRTGAEIRYAPVTPEGRICRTAFRSLLSPEIRVFGLVHASNVLGTINPVRELVEEVRATAPGAVSVVDAAQSVPHMPVDFDALGCDFLAFSGHKLYGPMGIGALVGRHERLEEMEPYQGGGEMIEQVTLQGTTFAAPPTRFEAGTPNAAGAIGLAAAIRYLDDLGMEHVRRHGVRVTAYALDRLRNAADLRVYGPLDPEERSPLVSFVDDDMHPHDLTALLDAKGIAVRSGHHCAQPLHDSLGLSATTRASFGLYNGEEDVDRLIEAILDARKMFGRARRRKENH
jgi:cysteine desulfurase/selenocysteine lyase